MVHRRSWAKRCAGYDRAAARGYVRRKSAAGLAPPSAAPSTPLPHCPGFSRKMEILQHAMIAHIIIAVHSSGSVDCLGRAYQQVHYMIF